MAAATERPQLQVFNSLGRKKTEFKPLDPNGVKVTWYCCGPTVYDAGHLGHARNYVSTDILRRIMDYLGYRVEFVMNITDVDDKIILRARQQHLLANFQNEHLDHSNEQAVETVKAAYAAYAKKNLPRLPSDLGPSTYEEAKTREYGAVLAGGTLAGSGAPSDEEAKVKMYIRVMDSATDALQRIVQDPSSLGRDDYFRATGEVLAPYLDSLHGASIPSDDYSIFQSLTRHWELQFEKDLKALNCLPPTRLTRVSEYIPEIVSFVERIRSKGFAYATSDGSVYFDIEGFEAVGNSYARLEPWNRNDKHLQADGEGSLAKKNTEKKSDADFALWKASKPGEPSWPSPWGPGRPGWHIECSVMASAVLGSRIDIHSGGVDLAFPHHDNELAQSEAYWVDQSSGTHDWVNYFLHTGHLSIKGSKMSKSLKNFTTIQDALKPDGGWTARRLRIVFLLGGWREPIEITSDVVKGASAWEATVNKFFTNVHAYLGEEAEEKRNGRIVPQRFGDPEKALRADLESAQLRFDRALLDSFNTFPAMSVVSDIIGKTNIYISEQSSSFSLASVKEVARWVTRVINIFGLDHSASAPDGGPKIGWSQATSTQDSEPEDERTQQEAQADFHRGVSSFRDGIRRAALKAAPEVSKELLELCDHLRDNVFVNEGIYLDDREPGQSALIKYFPKAELIAARQEQEKLAAEREKKKEAAKLERDRLEQERLEQGRLSHLEMFRTNEYSAWDEDGIPTKDAQGEDITKSRSKKLRKDWDRQKKKHETWLKSNESPK
ncbi:MAG: WD repeat-containing protein 70 [Watsoniomyces obsoletus]|nr:MAG: WD repeat-containing protein 70 [Watsoniomyces obsoletus]